MNIATNTTHYALTEEGKMRLEEKLAPIARLLGEGSDTALLTIEVESAPAEGRSSTPVRLSANLRSEGKTFHAEAVKPNIESAADRVRSELESEVRKSRGRAHRLWKRGHAAVKDVLRGWRD